MVLSSDLTSKIFLKNKNRTTPTTLPPPKQVRKANFYIFWSNVNQILHGSHLWRDTTKKENIKCPAHL